jgi:hypothetical protein
MVLSSSEEFPNRLDSLSDVDFGELVCLEQHESNSPVEVVAIQGDSMDRSAKETN